MQWSIRNKKDLWFAVEKLKDRTVCDETLKFIAILKNTYLKGLDTEKETDYNKQLRNDFIKIYSNFLQTSHEVVPDFNVIENKSLTSIINYLRKACKFDDSKAIRTWKAMLHPDNWAMLPEFYKKQRRIVMIDRYKLDILAETLNNARKINLSISSDQEKQEQIKLLLSGGI